MGVVRCPRCDTLNGSEGWGYCAECGEKLPGTVSFTQERSHAPQPRDEAGWPQKHHSSVQRFSGRPGRDEDEASRYR
jgi:hypothetical protein